MTAQVPAISVIICTHNPRRDYLTRTLEALTKQTLSRDKWELLLIDNASDERLEKSWDITWHPFGRHIREEKVGLTAARLRGIKEAAGELLIFVDDDNVLATDFLEQAVDVAHRYPYLGVFGAGAIEPEFEVPPASEVMELVGLLALRTVSAARWSNHYDDWPTIPWGAGLCVTRPVANEYVELFKQLANVGTIDRNGGSLYCGGDDLFSLVSVRLGKGFGIFPDLTITHLIPRERVTRAYFLRLIADKSTSSAIIRHSIFGVRPERPGLDTIIRTFGHGVRRGWFSLRCRLAEVSGNRRAAGMIETGKN